MRAVKWIIGAVLVLVISLAVYLVMVFNPNDFKGAIVTAVKKQTGRELLIGEDLSLSLFPKVSIKLGQIVLSNPDGFTPKEMLQVKQATVGVALMPLFSNKVEVSSLNLDGLIINLVTHKSGRTSMEGLVESDGKGDAAKPDKVPAAGVERLDIGGISIVNSQVNIIDEIKGTRQQFKLDKLSLGRFSLGQFAPFDYKLSIKTPDVVFVSDGQGKLRLDSDMKSIRISELKVENTIRGEAIPDKEIRVDLAAQADIFLDRQQAQLQFSKLTAGAINGKGSFDIDYGAKRPLAKVRLDFGDLDLDALLPKTGVRASEGKAATKEREADLTGLNLLDFNLALTAKSIKVANISSQNLRMQMVARNGVLNVAQATAQLYGGKVSASGQLDARQRVSRYRFSKKFEGVQIRPLLKDAADVEILSGTTHFTISGSGTSLIPDNIKRNLLANGRFEVADGAIYGVNIPYKIRSAQAKFKGQTLKEEEREKKTDFTSLTGSFTVANGVARNPDLRMASPLLRLRGAGTANLITEALDYKLTASVVGTLKGQGAEQNELKGFDIPIAITGTMRNPKYGLDMSGLVDAKLEKKKEAVKEKVKEKLFEKLRGL